MLLIKKQEIRNISNGTKAQAVVDHIQTQYSFVIESLAVMVWFCLVWFFFLERVVPLYSTTAKEPI